MFSINAKAASLSVTVEELGAAIDSIPGEPDALQRLLLEKIRRQIEQANLALNQGELLFSDTRYNIAPDSGCTRTEVRRLHTDITLESDTQLGLSFSSLYEPVRVTVDLNARIAADGRAKQIIGFRLGSCQDLATDNFSFTATGNAQLSVSVELRLNPTLSTSNRTLVLRPVVNLEGQLSRQNIQVEVDDSLLRRLLERVIEDQIDDVLDRNKVVEAMEKLEQNLRESLRNELEDGLITVNLPSPTDPQIDALYRLFSPEGDLSLSRGYVRSQRIPLLAALLTGDEDTSRAILSTALECEAAGLLQIPLQHQPVYTVTGAGCVATQIPTDVRGSLGQAINSSVLAAANDTRWYEEASCQREIDFQSVSTVDYCNAVLDTNRLGNAASGADQLERWTLSPGTRFDIGAVTIAGKQQPFTQRVAYKSIATNQGDCSLEMRIHTPQPVTTQSPDQLPTQRPTLRPLIAYHGGSWQRRSSGALGIESFATTLVNQGFVVFAPFYRLIGTSEGNIECNNATLDQVLDDASDAMDWVQENAARYGAAGKPVLFGQSAGGHLAGVLSVERPQEVASAVLFYAPTDFADFARQLIEGDIDTQTGQRILEAVLGETLETLDLNAPIIRRNSLPDRIISEAIDMPPVFLLHGQADTVLPYTQSVRLCQALSGELPISTPSSGSPQGAALRRIELCDDNDSQLHVIAQGEHALDLCIAEELCLAGSPDSARLTTDSIEQMLNWLATAGREGDTTVSRVLEDPVTRSTAGGSVSWALIVMLLSATARPLSRFALFTH